ncbi:subtilisin family serine protease [Kribbella antiqua]|uniref:Subtilisin family serine protease n=1 Tax=Kribbella antiqua TaxID=2512217 RepID=A0A4R2IYX3_9ACTN|nr:S8 family serine peptidase [Kribbella antiqua]TCO50507.1 subtilisin family serine protease [Kribbella antiqua]
MFRPVHLLRLAVPAALVAGGLVVLASSSGSAAEPGPYRPPVATKRSPATPQYEPNSVMVKFKKSASASARKSAVSKLRTTTEDSVSAGVVKLTGSVSAPELLKKVKADKTVELASLNYVRRISATPNDDYYPVFDGVGQSPYLNTVRMPQAWDLSKSTGSQTVAVLDTGVDAGHPDLAGRLVPGYNAITNVAQTPVDDNGHGTMTLGIIAANTNNTIGIAGVGWSAKAMPVKVLDAEGSGYDDDIAEGIDWAVAHGAKVINMSLGGPGDNAVLHDAVKNAVAKGVVVVVAAGNDGTDVPQFPASYSEVIAVAAANEGGALTDFSSYGNWVDVAAPGWNIISTGVRSMTPAGYDPYWYCTGTSCSAPIVTGIAALVKNKWPSWTPAQIAARIKTTARDAGPRGADPYYGYGNVDAYAALGGRWTTDFAVNTPDGNDQPARAVALTSGTSSTINTEGEVDWYKVNSAAARNLTVKLTGPVYDYDVPANIGPRVDVYDADLKSLGHAVNPFPADYDPENKQPLTATVDVSVPAGDAFIAVRNDNGSRDSRYYTLSITEGGAGGSSAAVDYPVRNVAPNDLWRGSAVTTKPTVTFAREVLASSVTGSTVRLVNAKAGTAVAGSVSYDAATKQAVFTPSAALRDNTPYKLVVSGVQDAGGTALATFSSVFATADNAPPAVGSFDASGAPEAANLSWTVPALSDLDQVIVRRNASNTVPTLTTGTQVYAGTGTSVKNTGLKQGVTYTWAAWVKDRSGKVSPAAVTRLIGMKSSIATTSTLITNGTSVTLKGSVLRIDNKAYAGLPVNLYVRPNGATSFTRLATVKATSTGALSYAYKPSRSSVFTYVFGGNADLMSTRTPYVTVQVRPAITASLSPATVRPHQLSYFAGKVTPWHTGKTVYLQQYTNGAWKTVTSTKLTSSGGYTFGLFKTTGKYSYRLLCPADFDHAQAISATKVLTVS